MNPSPWTPAAPAATPALSLSEQIQRAQAAIVQHHYVRSQVRTIASGRDQLIKETLALLQKDGVKDLKDAWHKINGRLSTADLTINFRAAKWFVTPNNYETYSQMYERAVRTVTAQPGSTFKTVRLDDSDAVNPARTRQEADDLVTFPKHVVTQGGYIATSSGAARVMSTGGLQAPSIDARPHELEAVNPHFNPKTKQIFAALNFGHRPHGANCSYGRSFFVLNPRLKVDALYFAGDTFKSTEGEMSVADQISCELLPALYLKAHAHLRGLLQQSCLYSMDLSDRMVDSFHEMIEAHLFQELKFQGNIEKIYLSCSDLGIDTSNYAAIKANAQAFATRVGAEIFFLDDDTPPPPPPSAAPQPSPSQPASSPPQPSPASLHSPPPVQYKPRS